MANFHILIAAILYLATGCTNIDRGSTVSNSNNAVSIKKDTAVDQEADKFKEWVRDTINNHILAKSSDPMATQQYIKKLDITRDSQVLTIIYNYHLTIGQKKREKSEDVQTVLQLLKKYDELPKGPFDLRFAINYEYSPSTTIPCLIRDEYSYLSDLVVTTGADSIASRYEYVRGRLSYKIVESDKHGSKRKRTEFIWNGNKLTKDEFELSH
jgi:hypothetical protein